MGERDRWGMERSALLRRIDELECQVERMKATKLHIDPPRNTRNIHSRCSWLGGPKPKGLLNDLVCSWCGKVVGKLNHLQMEFMDADAGWVLDRVEPTDLKFPGHPEMEELNNPLACSDECERQILYCANWTPCAPPPGYRRFSEGLRHG